MFLYYETIWLNLQEHSHENNSGSDHIDTVAQRSVCNGDRRAACTRAAGAGLRRRERASGIRRTVVGGGG